MRQADVAKTAVWRWQERFMAEGVDGLLRDKTRPSRIAPLDPAIARRVVTHMLGPVPGETTHQHPKVRAWLERHPRWTVHFTPTSASWLNAVEGCFAKLTKQRLKHGVFHSLVSLQAAIKRYLAEANTKPRTFQWTKDPDGIIAAVQRGHQASDSIH